MQMWVVLGSIAVVNWFVFEKTKQGLALAVLCAMAAPLSELVLINFLHLWHYPQPDWFGDQGVPSWVSRWIPADGLSLHVSGPWSNGHVPGFQWQA